MVVEGFGNTVEFGGFTFSSVKVFHPRKGNFGTLSTRALLIFISEYLGVTYLADPICDDVHATLPLEVHIITFASGYYASSQGESRRL